MACLCNILTPCTNLVPNALITLFAWFVHFDVYVSSTWRILSLIPKVSHKPSIPMLRARKHVQCLWIYDSTLHCKVYCNILWQAFGGTSQNDGTCKNHCQVLATCLCNFETHIIRELEMIAELQVRGIEFQNAQEKTFGNNVNKIVFILTIKVFLW